MSTLPNFDYWKRFATLRVWEVATLMNGIDPNVLGDVVDKDGDGLDLSIEERMLTSAISVGALVAPHLGTQVPTNQTDIAVTSLGPWLRSHGLADLADALEADPANDNVAPPMTSAQADPERRLAALRALGGTAKWKRSRDGGQKWTFTKIGALANQEATAGHSRSDEKTIRKDLSEAAEAENIARRSGNP